MTAVHIDDDGQRFEHVKVTAPDNEAIVTSSVLKLPTCDTMDLSYDASGNVSSISYKKDAVEVGTMTLTYSGDVITKVVVDNKVN